jgi:hypothetical protein
MNGEEREMIIYHIKGTVLGPIFLFAMDTKLYDPFSAMEFLVLNHKGDFGIGERG